MTASKEKASCHVFLAPTCWAINIHTGLENTLCEKAGVMAEGEGREETLRGKKDVFCLNWYADLRAAELEEGIQI